jgi:hypothetical protein
MSWGLSNYNIAAGSNTQINGANIAVNCPPSDVGQFMRQLMADLANWTQGNDPSPFTLAGAAVFNSTALFNGTVTVDGALVLNGSVTLTAAPSIGGQTLTSGWKNAVIGGDFSANPWQRSGPFVLTATKQYTADRIWALRSGGNYVIQKTSSVDIGYASQLSAQRTAGDSSASPMELACDLPSDLSTQLAGKICTFTIRGTLGANISGSLSIAVVYGTGQNQSLSAGYTGQTILGSINLISSLSTTAANASISFTLPSTATQIGIVLTHTPGGTAGASDSFGISAIQLEPNAGFTGFERRAPELEKLLCQQFTFVPDVGTGDNAEFMGMCTSTTGGNIIIPLPVPMFRVPTSVSVGTVGNHNVKAANNADIACTSLALSAGNGSRTNTDLTFAVAAGLVAGNATRLRMGDFLTISCEL